MDDIKRHYEVLGLEFGASSEEIKKAYYRLAHVWHPDRYVHNPPLRKIAEQNMKEINVAYERLSKFRPVLRPEPIVKRPTPKARPSAPSPAPAPPPASTSDAAPEVDLPAEPWFEIPPLDFEAWPWRSIFIGFLFIVAIGFLIFLAQS